MRWLRGWSKSRLAAVLAIFFAIAHCDGGGCGGCDTCGMTEIPGGFPANQRIENGIQIRLASHGIGFVEQNAGNIIADLMPDGLQFEVPPSCDMDATVTTIDICGTGDANQCDPIDPPCLLDIIIEELIITPQDPPGNLLDVEAHVNVQTVPGHHIRTFGSGADCDIYIDTTDGSQAYVRVLTTVTFNIDPVSGRTAIEVGELTIPDGDIEDADIDIEGPLISLCTVIEWFAEGILVGEITNQLDGIMGPMMEGMCMACDQGQQCPQLSTCDGDICQEDSGVGCVMPLGMEGRMDLGSVTAAIAPGKEAYLDIHTWLGGSATTNAGGVSLGMHGGAMTPVHDDCVPLRDPPDLTPAPVSSAFQANTRPTDGADYQVGFGVHKKFLDAAGYAVYDSGMLCLDVGPRESDLLVAGTFSIMIPSIYEVSHGDEAPIVVAVRPQNPLVFELSEQELTQDPGTGEYEIVTPLLTVTSADFAIDFYALIDYRFVRIFRINADLAIPIALTVNGQNQLVPVIGDLEDAFGNLTVTDSYLLEEDPQDLALIFPTLLGLVTGMLNITPFDLPDMQGFTLIIDEGGITSVDGNSLLAIYANLSYSTPSPKGAVPAARTTVALLDQHTPPAASFRVRSLADYYGQGAPSVTLELGGTAPDGTSADLEWQYRFDGGLWSPFTDASVVTLRRPVFYLQGHHHIDVRARVKGAPRTLDPQPVRVDFIVDAQPPELVVFRNGNRLSWAASDNVTHERALEYAVRIGTGPWSPWQAGLTGYELLADFDGPIAVRVCDESGNETESGEVVVALYGRIKVPPSESSCDLGCKQGPGGGLAWLTLVVLGLWIVRRRRSGKEARRPGGRRLPFFAVLLALSAPGTNCDCGKGSGDNSNALCPDGGIALVCTNPDLECVPGLELEGTEPMTLDASSCEPIPVLCECVGEPDQVAPDDYGRFLSVVARDGDVYVSCYSDRYTDLVVATVDGTGLVPEAVDGVPDGPVDLDPEGYRGGVIAKGPNVGTHTSAAIATDGTVYVSYVHENEGSLKVAQGVPGSWDLHEVETYTDENPRAWYTALQLLGDGRPAVAYMVGGLVDPSDPTRRISQVRYAVAQVTDPSDASDWNIEVVDATRIPCAGLCDSGELCVESTWTCEPEDPSCGTCDAGDGCVGGACVAILEEPAWADHPEGIGLYIHAGLLSDGRPVLAYHDRTSGLARLAIHDGVVWDATTLEGDDYHDVGLYISMTVDASDVLHLSYVEAHASRNDLIYAQVDSTGALVLREIIDDGNRGNGIYDDIGADSVIFFDGPAPTVLYQDGTTLDLLIAVRNGASDWTWSPLSDGETNYGFFVDVAVDTDGTIWVAQYIYDWSADELNRVEAFTLP